MPLPDKFYDPDGKEMSLDGLCRKEPAWAANRIRLIQQELDGANAMVSAIERLVPGWERHRDLAEAVELRLQQSAEPDLEAMGFCLKCAHRPCRCDEIFGEKKAG